MDRKPVSQTQEGNLTNIVEFLSVEHQQLITSMANLAGEFGRIQQIDDYFWKFMYRFVISEDDHIIIAMLSRAAHRQYYISLSQYLRTEFSEAMNALRHSLHKIFEWFAGKRLLPASLPCTAHWFGIPLEPFRNRADQARPKPILHERIDLMIDYCNCITEPCCKG